MATINNFAILIDSLGFSYNRDNPVLIDVTIRMPKGQIYALLGSNGCGKTTLINILLGRIQPQTGSVRIMEHPESNTDTAWAPRVRHTIGYMPQHISLNDYLSIAETFHYFARANHTRDKNFVRKRIETYLEMLALNDAAQRVVDLSGGQRRLLSLGVTLIHNPRILFLDEPTVGVDSLIRCNIWKHLNELCEKNGTTVLITTHYIDEAKQAHLAGFLRDGRMLAEESPSVLMRALDSPTFEDVFYKLSYLQNKSKKSKEKSNDHSMAKYFRYATTTIIDDDNNEQSTITSRENNAHMKVNKNCSSEIVDQNDMCYLFSVKLNHETENGQSPSSKTVPSNHPANNMKKLSVQLSPNRHCANSFFNHEHLLALFYRELILLKSYLLILILYLLVPSFSIWAFQLGYGRVPRNYDVAVYNGDVGQSNSTPNVMSELYIRNLISLDSIRLKYFPDELSAFESVKAGRSLYAIAFRPNFTSLVIERFNPTNLFDSLSKSENENENKNGADSIHFYYDMSNSVTIRFVNRTVLLAFQRTMEQYAATHGMNPYIFSLPIETKQIYYGQLEANVQPVFQSGVILTALMSLTMAFATLKIVLLRQNGCLERDLNQCIKPFEILFALQTLQMGAIAVKVFLTMLVAFHVIGLPLEGSFIEAFALIFLTTCQGVFIGTLIGIFSHQQIKSMIVLFMTMSIIFLSSGTLWPIEGMPSRIQMVLRFNPLTIPIQSLRSIMLRGWSVTRFPVLLGYLTSAGFCIVFFALNAISFQYFSN